MNNYFEYETSPNLDNRYSQLSVNWPASDSFLYMRLYLL